MRCDRGDAALDARRTSLRDLNQLCSLVADQCRRAQQLASELVRVRVELEQTSARLRASQEEARSRARSAGAGVRGESHREA